MRPGLNLACYFYVFPMISLNFNLKAIHLMFLELINNPKIVLDIPNFNLTGIYQYKQILLISCLSSCVYILALICSSFCLLFSSSMHFSSFLLLAGVDTAKDNNYFH